METTIRAIRTDLRLSMNGPVAAGMRKMGVSYRLIFGVDLPRLQEISRKYEPGAALAERLWSEDARELKILATLLYPPGEMNVEAANRWVEQIDNQELREQVCKNLFECAVADLKADSPMLYQSALGALRFFGRTSRQRSERVLWEVSSFESSSCSREREMFDQLKCEFDYSW